MASIRRILDRQQLPDQASLIGVFAFALAARWCVAVYRLGPDFDFGDIVASVIANNLLAGYDYSFDPPVPTGYPPWGYVSFLVVHKSVFGTGSVGYAGLAAIAAVGALNASLCALLGRMLFDMRVGVVAGGLYALTPYLASQELAETGLLNSTLLLALLATLAHVRSARRGWAAVAGLFSGWAYLIRPEIALVPITLAAVMATSGARRIARDRMVAAAVFAAVALIVVGPWIVRNWMVFGRFLPAHSTPAVALWQGSHPRAFEIYPEYSLDEIFEYTGEGPPAGLDELTANDWLAREAWQNISANPGFYIAGSVRRWLLLWDWRLVYRLERARVGDRTVSGPRPPHDHFAYTLPYVLTAVLALGGLIRIRHRLRLVAVGTILVAAYTLPHALTLSYTRYRMRIEFMLILLAAVQAIALIDWNTRRRHPQVATPSAAS